MTMPWENDPIKNSWEADSIVKPIKQRSTGIMPQVNKAIAELITFVPEAFAQGATLIPGVPKDVAGMPRKAIKAGFKAIGAPIAERGAKTPGEHFGKALGETATMMIPGGLAVKGIAKGTGLAANITKTILKSMGKSPILTMTGEMSAGIGAGAGRAVASIETDDPTKQLYAEMAGGAAGGLVPTAVAHTTTGLLYRGGKILLKKLHVPFTKSGAKFRAGRFLKEKVADPTDVIKDVGEETIGDLPPIVKAGQDRLTSLHKALLKQDPAQNVATVQKLSRSITKLEGEMRKLGYGSPELLADVMKRRVSAIEGTMNKRISVAMKNAQKQLDSLPVATRQTQESKIVRDELENTMRLDKADVDNIWKDVPKDFEVTPENTRSVYNDIKVELAEAQAVDIPSPLKTSSILSEEGSTTLKEIQGLRSKLLETARIARKKGQWNKSRIASEVADAILDDLGIVAGKGKTPEAESLRTAIAATRKFKEKYETGITGKILGFSKSGAPSIDPTETLDISVGRRGFRGAIDVEKVAATPDAIDATKRYISRSYTDYSTDSTGKIIPSKSDRWMRENEDLLDLFPDLKSKMTKIGEAQVFADNTHIVMESRRKALQDPKISMTAKFLKSSDLSSEIDVVFKSPGSDIYMNELVKQTRKDKTGKAIEGLRSGVVDYLMQNSSGNQFNDLGERVLSGNKLALMLKDNQKMLKKVFTDVQINRLERISQEFRKLESYEGVRAGKPDIKLDDWASGALRIFSRIVGARVGGAHGRDSVGGSLQMAQIYSGKAQDLMKRLTRDKAVEFVKEALLSNDPKLFKALMATTKPKGPSWKEMIIINKRMNIWLAGTGKRVLENIQENKGD